MQQIKWIVINGLFAVAIYFGFQEKIDGVYRLVMFWAWVNIVFSFFLLAEPVMEKMRETGRSTPRWASVVYDLCVTSAFVWFGAWVTGAFWLLHMFIQEAAWDKALGKSDD